MIRIGVTGPMASGKTDVARHFEARGASVLSGDALGWEVLASPEVRRKIGELFGPSVLLPTGFVDRQALSRIVFKNASELARLNALVQPILERTVREALEDATGEGVLVLDAALLGAWNLADELDGVVEVDAPSAMRIRRLAATQRFSESEARQRVEGQKLPPVGDARKRWKIENAGTKEELRARADEIWEEIERLRSEAGKR